MVVSRQTVQVDGQSVSLSNLDKILYPGNGFTKAQVIDYYIRIAPWLLPHYKRRPITMLRFPDGVSGKAFYEKDAPKHTPDWVHTTNVPRQNGGTIRYVCLDDLPTLVWCANLASLELHPFMHRAERVDRPDAVVFDLDPGEGTTLVMCAEVAFSLKALLEVNGLQSLPKVSGSKGLQLHVPLNTAVTYAKTRSFAQAAAVALEQQNPKGVISEMAKNLRKGKIFIDWSQNSDFKTTIGVYSLRAKSDEPFVAMPVTWDELATLQSTHDIAKLRFTPQAALRRMESIGDLFAPLLNVEQALPAKLRSTSATPNIGPRTSAADTKPISKGSDVAEKLSRLPKAPAEFIEPMLLLRTEQLPEGPNWLYELKLDGYRAIAAKLKGQVHLWSRNQNDFGARYPAIAKKMKTLPEDTVVDGEIVALDAEGKPSFNALQNSGSQEVSIVYYLFDVLILQGRDVRGLPLEQRRALLEESVLPNLAEPVRTSPILPGKLADLVRSVKEQALEGLVAKQRNSLYESGERSGTWKKMRVNAGQEFVIGGYTLGGATFDALVFGYYEGTQLMYAARTRSGFTPALRAQLMAKFRRLEIPDCPFANLPEKRAGRWGQGLTAAKMKDCRWLKPVLVGQFEFREWTPDNHLRHSRFVGLREDKVAKTVTRDQPPAQ